MFLDRRFALCTLAAHHFRYFLIVSLTAVINWKVGPVPKFAGKSTGSTEETVKVEATIEAPSTTYSITATYQRRSEADKPEIIHLKKPVETWFHANGHLDVEAIYKDLKLLAPPKK